MMTDTPFHNTQNREEDEDDGVCLKEDMIISTEYNIIVHKEKKKKALVPAKVHKYNTEDGAYIIYIKYGR